jgi:hypothetical protein
LTHSSLDSANIKSSSSFNRVVAWKASGDSIRVIASIRSLIKEEEILQETAYQEQGEDEQEDSYTIGYNYSSQEEEY